MLPRIRTSILIDGLGWGGAEALLPEFVSAAETQGLEVSLAYLREKDGSPASARLRRAGVDPIGLDIGGLLRPASLRRVRDYLAATAPDVVHTHLGYADLLGGLAGGLLGIPVVSTIHVTAWPTTPRDRVKSSISRLIRRCAVSRTIAVSDAAGRAFVAARMGSSQRVVTVRNGIAGIARPGSGIAVRAALGIGADELVVGMLSVLRAGKGHVFAIDAVEAMRDEVPGVRLLVAGDGPLRRQLEQRLDSSGDTVLLTGHRDDVMEVLDAIDLLVLPSAAEAFPTALLEAMAASVPVVACDVGGVPEIVVDEVTGTLVRAPPSAAKLVEALRPYLLSKALRRERGRAGRRRFEQEFTLERWVAETANVYREVIAEQPRPCQALARRFLTDARRV